MSSLFLGNNRRHRLVCAKTISSLVRKVLWVAKAHMSPGSFWGPKVLAAGISLVSILQAGDWAKVFTPARHYFPPTSLLWIGTRNLYSMLCWASVSSCSLGKFQTLTIIQSLANVGLLGHRSPQYRTNSFSIVCAVLALDSWNYCSGEQARQPKHLPLNVCLTWLL